MPKKKSASATPSTATARSAAARADKNPKLASVLSPQLPASLDALQSSYAAAEPYPHAVIHDLCNEADARAMIAEISALAATLKETDLFKVYQTGDLANADEHDPEHVAKLGTLLRLRRELNSPAFKAMIERITGCGPLSDKVDLSANAYGRGCHLLCHDDVISTRRVSYIVYLSDPDEPWLESDGGRLELYASNGLLPDPEPCARVMPEFNTMAVFVVQPGVSFHSVEEVYGDSPRLSLQGWFHAAAEPADVDKASLQQLLNSPGVLLPKEPVPLAAHGALSAADVRELRQWINPMFLTEQAMDQICAKCETADACVSLVKFLHPELSARLRRTMLASSGDGEDWRVTGPAHMQRFQRLDLTRAAQLSRQQQPPPPAEAPTPSMALELARLTRDRLQSRAFLRFLERVTALKLSSSTTQVRRFRAGSDYTVATAMASEGAALDVTLCFVDDAGHKADAWASGEVGGFDLYLERENEERQGDVAVYSRDDEGEGVVCIDPAFATLGIVFRDASRMHFVKYLSKSAPSARYDVSAVYAVQEEAEEEQE